MMGQQGFVDKKPGGGWAVPRGYAAVQEDMEGLQKWAQRSLMESSKGKCKVLHMVRKSHEPALCSEKEKGNLGWVRQGKGGGSRADLLK